MRSTVQERWLSGRRHVPAKDAYPSKGTVGSNPTLSVSHFALSALHSRLFFILVLFKLSFRINFGVKAVQNCLKNLVYRALASQGLYD